MSNEVVGRPFRSEPRTPPATVGELLKPAVCEIQSMVKSDAFCYQHKVGDVLVDQELGVSLDKLEPTLQAYRVCWFHPDVSAFQSTQVFDNVETDTRGICTEVRAVSVTFENKLADDVTVFIYSPRSNEVGCFGVKTRSRYRQIVVPAYSKRTYETAYNYDQLPYMLKYYNPIGNEELDLIALRPVVSLFEYCVVLPDKEYQTGILYKACAGQAVEHLEDVCALKVSGHVVYSALEPKCSNTSNSDFALAFLTSFKLANFVGVREDTNYKSMFTRLRARETSAIRCDNHGYKAIGITYSLSVTATQGWTNAYLAGIKRTGKVEPLEFSGYETYESRILSPIGAIPCTNRVYSSDDSKMASVTLFRYDAGTRKWMAWDELADSPLNINHVGTDSTDTIVLHPESVFVHFNVKNKKTDFESLNDEEVTKVIQRLEVSTITIRTISNEISMARK